MYNADSNRYNKIPYRRCGKSGLKLPAISLGLWHNFGGVDTLSNARDMILLSFDEGITHFDLANNYGPPPGSAESTFGTILKKDLHSYRDELIISTKAGWMMWDGPYGDFGSKKYLVASLDQSLKRMGLDYVDIYYHHRPDFETPLEETLGALDLLVRQGKTLYVGISSYSPELTKQSAKLFAKMGTPFIIQQPVYNMFNRSAEKLFPVLQTYGLGCIVFSPLAQGLLTDKYLKGIPKDSRMAKESGYLQKDALTESKLKQISMLNEVAGKRGQTLAQMAVSWTLRNDWVTSCLIGASSPQQIKENLKSLDNLEFSEDELANIEKILNE